MPLSPEEMKKIASLARLQFDEQESPAFLDKLSTILSMVEEMSGVDTSSVDSSSLLSVPQRLRKDEVTVLNERDAYQRIAPDVLAGLYLVPKVIE